MRTWFKTNCPWDVTQLYWIREQDHSPSKNWQSSCVFQRDIVSRPWHYSTRHKQSPTFNGAVDQPPRANRPEKILITLYVVEKLATAIILKCDFWHRHIEAIRSRRRGVELDDGATVPIVQSSSARSKFKASLSEAQVYILPKGCKST